MLSKSLVAGASLLALSVSLSGNALAGGSGSYDWSGPYLGIKGGGAFDGSASQSNAGFTSGNFDIDGFTIGIMSGYNFQHGDWVFGIDSDYSFADIDGSTAAAACVTTCQTEIDYLGTTRARIGFAMDRFLPYATAGFASALVDGSTGGVSSSSKFHFGWTAGGGLEWAMADGWSMRAEYLYVDLSSRFHNPPVNFDVDDLHVIRAGISMNTGWLWDSILGR